MMRRPRQRAEDTREDILTTAETLFRQRGFSAVSVVDIAAFLQMSPANVYKHFKTKAELANAISERHLEKTAGRFAVSKNDLPPGEEMLHFILRLLDAHLQDIEENPYIFDMIVQTITTKMTIKTVYRTRIAQVLSGIIQRGIDQGLYHCADVDKIADMATHMVACILHPVLIASDDKADLRQRAQDIVLFLDESLKNRLVK